MGVESLRKTAEVQLLQQLRKSIEEEKETATFACGGSIPIVYSSRSAEEQHTHTTDERSLKRSSIPPDDDEAKRPKSQDERPVQHEDAPLEQMGTTWAMPKGFSTLDYVPTSAPVILRWDHQKHDTPETGASKLVLPLEPKTRSNLEQLVRDSQPATFGYKGKDVYDETYRKATKLDDTEFSSNFNPYELGIVDIVTQLLLPSIKTVKGLRGVRAQLYKLNVYSGPSGKFHAHVDTPRSESQFGSLVVCLPCAHEGGELLVRHKGRTMCFDWGSGDTCVQWAAFYSDCEHEVLEVRSGHRITLTYNLYVTRGAGLLTGYPGSMDPTQLPLYGIARELFAQPGFMPRGGVLGMCCSHAYAHADENSIADLPAALKGVDMAIYEAFRALGFDVRLRPVMDKDDCYDRLDYEEPDDSEESEEHQSEGDVCEFSPAKDEIREMPRPLTNETILYPNMQGRADRYPIGHELWPSILVDEEVDDNLNFLEDVWPHDYKRIHWLTPTSRHEEKALVYLAYGNQAELGVKYSSAALLVTVPPSTKRIQMLSP